MKTWDAFISHASEDNEVVHALTDSLRRAGIRVWVDQQELRLGDSLSERIDDGLAASRFGIVLLSPHFLAKRWPRQELNGLMAREDGGERVILPVWHNVTKEMLASYSPMLADRLAADTEDGVTEVAARIVVAITDRASGSPAVETPTLAGRLLSILDITSQPNTVRDFLLAHPSILGQALGTYGQRPDVRGAICMGSVELDLCVRLETGATTRTYTWVLIQLEAPSQTLFEAESSPTESVGRRVGDLESFRRWTSEHLDEADRRLPGFVTTFEAIVVAGRRELLHPAALDGLRRYNTEHAATTLRTYDWLLDAASSLG